MLILNIFVIMIVDVVEGDYMPQVSIFYTLIQFAFAILLGIAFYFFMTDETKQFKKQAIEQFLSYLINFILYLQVGKIILNIPLLIKDPFAILAYPGDRFAFYLATVFTLVHSFIQAKRGKVKLLSLFQTSFAILLVSFFVYDFIELIIADDSRKIILLFLNGGLILLYVFIHNVKTGLIFSLWAFIQLIFASYYSYTTIYNFLITPIYFIVILLLAAGYKLYKRRIA